MADPALVEKLQSCFVDKSPEWQFQATQAVESAGPLQQAIFMRNADPELYLQQLMNGEHG